LETNGTKKFNLQSALLIITLLFLVVDRFIVPSVVSANLVSKVDTTAGQTAELSREIHQQGLDIAMLKECIIALRPLPTQVAEIKAILKVHMEER
jgi:hypothetical protein